MTTRKLNVVHREPTVSAILGAFSVARMLSGAGCSAARHVAECTSVVVPCVVTLIDVLEIYYSGAWRITYNRWTDMSARHLCRARQQAASTRCKSTQLSRLRYLLNLVGVADTNNGQSGADLFPIL